MNEPIEEDSYVNYTTGSLPTVFKKSRNTFGHSISGKKKKKISTLNGNYKTRSSSKSRNKSKRKRPATTAVFHRSFHSQDHNNYNYNNNESQTSKNAFKFQKRFFYPMLPDDLVNTKSIPSDDHWDYSFRDKRGLVEEAFRKLYPILNRKDLYDGVKKTYVRDLFQIAHFYYNESKINEKEIFSLETQKRQMEEKIEKSEKSDFELISEAPTNDDFFQMKKSVVDLKNEVKKYIRDTTNQSFSDSFKSISAKQEKKEKSTPVSKKKKINKSTEKMDISSDENRGFVGKEYPGYNESGKTEVSTSLVSSDSDSVSWAKYIEFIKEKFRILENFIVHLKKRISIMEQSDDDMRTLINDYGSVSELMVEMDKIKKEMKSLKRVREKFNHDILLDRRIIQVSSLDFLKSVILGLQNELLNYKEILGLLMDPNKEPYKTTESRKEEGKEEKSKDDDEKKKVEEKNKIIGREKVFNLYWSKKYSRLENLIKDEFSSNLVDDIKNKTLRDSEDKIILSLLSTEELDRKKKVKETHENTEKSDLADAKRKIMILEYEKKQLEESKKKYQTQCQELDKSLYLMEKLVKKSDGKFQLKEMSIMLRRQLDVIKKRRDELEEKEERFIHQEKLLEQLRKERKDLVLTKAYLKEKLDKVITQNKQMKSRVEFRNIGVNVLKQVSLSLIKAILEKKIGRVINDEKYLNFLYSQLYDSHFEVLNSVVKLQAWWRGVSTRRKLLKQGVYCVKIRNNCSKKERGEGENKKENPIPRENSKLKILMNSFDMIQKVCFHSGCATNLENISYNLNLIKREVGDNLKNDIRNDLERTRKDMEEMKNKIIKKISDFENREMKNRYCQTDKVNKTSISLQTGATQIMKIQVRHNVIATPSNELSEEKEKKKVFKTPNIKKKNKKKKKKEKVV